MYGEALVGRGVGQPLVEGYEPLTMGLLLAPQECRRRRADWHSTGVAHQITGPSSPESSRSMACVRGSVTSRGTIAELSKNIGGPRPRAGATTMTER